jgi:nucleoside-diphosphate-sugar epimerase
MKSVLITGAEGMIGSRLRVALADRYDVRALTRAPVAGLESYVADIADLKAVLPACQGVAAVVHLAASPAVQTPWEEVLRNNLIGTYNVFEAARRGGARQIIFASSNHAVGMFEVEGSPAIYRQASGVMVDEHAPVRPDSLYGVSKAYGEALGRYFSEQHSMSVYCLRIGSVRANDNPHSEELLASGPDFLSLTTREQRARRMSAVWMSHADLARLVDACLRAEHIRFGIYYGVSDNPYRFWSIENAFADLGWRPLDAAPPVDGEP